MGDVVAIVNPIAGRGKCGKLWPRIAAYLEEIGLSLQVQFTQAAGDAIQLARQAAAGGASAVLAVGGDGTLNEVVNGLVDYPETVLGVIPAGSGNDFIRSLGLKPSDWQAACRLIAQGKTKKVDLGRVNGRHFINVAGIGFDATVVSYANTWGKAHFSGTLAYVAAVLKTLLEFKPSRIKINLDGQQVETLSWFVAVASGQYFGGGMWIAPQAALDDGLFDVIVLGDVSKLEFLRAFPTIFSGKHLYHPAIKLFRARHVQVEAHGPMVAQTDGEVIGQTPITFQVRSSALRVFCN